MFTLCVHMFCIVVVVVVLLFVCFGRQPDQVLTGMRDIIMHPISLLFQIYASFVHAHTLHTFFSSFYTCCFTCTLVIIIIENLQIDLQVKVEQSNV